MNKTTTAIILLVILASAGYFFVKDLITDKPVDPSVYQSETAPLKESEMPSPATESGSVSANTHTVLITDAGFSPLSLTVRQGDTVIWKNESSGASWPASAKHPTHKDYPTTGGCLGSTFDACRGIAPGESWSFTFNEIGDWNFHDHVNPAWNGKIIVIK